MWRRDPTLVLSSNPCYTAIPSGTVPELRVDVLGLFPSLVVMGNRASFCELVSNDHGSVDDLNKDAFLRFGISSADV